jgi:hypothetical protein
MTNHILEAVALIKSEVARLQGVLATLENGSPSAARSMPVPAPSATVRIKSTAAARGGTKKRTRRSSAEVMGQARAMVDFIKSKGKSGATTAAIVGEFGKTLPSIKAFISAKLPTKIKTVGAGRATVYVID